MTIFTLFFSLSWLQILNLLALLQSKNTRIGPFPWKRSVLQNPDRERTNHSTGICREMGLPYNNGRYFTAAVALLNLAESALFVYIYIKIKNKKKTTFDSIMQTTPIIQENHPSSSETET